jgi:hypothetical protein
MRSRLVLAHSEVGSKEFKAVPEAPTGRMRVSQARRIRRPGELLGTLVAAFGHAQEMADRVSKGTDKVSDAARVYY